MVRRKIGGLKGFLKKSAASSPEPTPPPPPPPSPPPSPRSSRNWLRLAVYLVLVAIPIRMIPIISSFVGSPNKKPETLQFKVATTNNDNNIKEGSIAEAPPKQGIDYQPPKPPPSQMHAEWKKINPKETRFPLDVFCQERSDSNPDLDKTQYNCVRKCEHVHPPNMILYMFASNAGLGDRESMLSTLVDLAGYLCATVYAPGPAMLLAPEHNQGHMLDWTLQWKDFFDISFHNKPTQALKDVTPHEQQNRFKGWIEKYHDKNSPERWTGLHSANPSDMVEHFKRAVDLSRTFNKGFIWVIYPDWYIARQPLMHYLEDQEDELHLPLAYWQNSYSHHELPRRLMDVVIQIWDAHILSANRIVGSWHIRRTDAKSECDTSLSRMETYIQCSFQNTEHLPLTVVLQTDEQSPEYTSALQEYFTKYASHVQLILVDGLARERMEKLVELQTLPASFMNNFHVFQVASGVVAKSNAFHLEHRRHYQCPDCVPLSDQLAKKGQTIP